MSEYDSSPVRDSCQASTTSEQRNSSNEENLDDTVGAGNNSIIGKVKSRVSSIIPNSFSKWFSPSMANRNNDSINGNISEGGGEIRSGLGGVARRRRRIEVDTDEADDDDDDENTGGAAQQNSLRLQQNEEQSDEESINSEENDNSEDESNNSEEDTMSAMRPDIGTRRSLNTSSNIMRQPPAKRSRLHFDATNMRDSPIQSRQPLVASTPAVGSNVHNVISNASATKHRYNYMISYGQQSKREPAYSFHVGNAKTQSSADIIDLVPVQTATDSTANTTQNTSNAYTNVMSSRRSLNIPKSSQLTTFLSSSNLKRQTLASIKNEIPSTSTGLMNKRNITSSRPSRTSTMLVEIETDEKHENNEEEDGEEEEADAVGDELHELNTSVEARKGNSKMDKEATKYNGRSATTSKFNANKRIKLINGRSLTTATTSAVGTAPVYNLDDDTSSESSECGSKNVDSNNGGNSATTLRNRTGLFNMSGANSRNGSRTSSCGNGLNFYTHLEGRKSLFAGGAHGSGVAAAGGGNSLNNSTLSLTSLNRRQFNASIYGSTSALSDSRLLNTFSPFYKGRTTYGGAAAYNKYTSGSGTGANVVRLTPTLIRPTSSLSTLSSSSNSLAATGANINSGAGENSSAISSTAKRILDLINEFATPLSEAKKMANNLKINQQQLLPQTKARLNEADLHAQRAMRLSQVRTPYMRPAFTLQPTHLNGKATSILPPIRELQVPSMSQLLQMKKLQSTTERSRQIATQNRNNPLPSAAEAALNSSYTLPNYQLDGSDKSQQQKHTNKIKNKSTNTARVTKDTSTLVDDAPPPPVNLPNIAFPLMKSVPKIDIALPNLAKTTMASTTSTSTATAFGAKSLTTTKSVANSESHTIFEFNQNRDELKPTLNTPTPTSSKALKAGLTANFKFSAPLELKNIATPTQNITPINKNYRFSPPTLVNCIHDDVTSRTPAKVKQQLSPEHTVQPQLKTGSVLDALKKPFTLSTTASSATKASDASQEQTRVSSSSSQNIFGSQFKKSSSEWECDTCMIRNKQDLSKCAACEMPRKSTTATTTATIPTTSTTSINLSSSSNFGTTMSNFGSQFKKSAGEWECDACMLRNKPEASKCVACETPKKTTLTATATVSAKQSQLETSSCSDSFGSQFKRSSSEWDCDACMVRNTQDANKCIACETSRKSATAAPKLTTNVATTKPSFTSAAVPLATNTFGDAFKPKSNTWECPTCLINNNLDASACLACQTKKPGSTNVSSNSTAASTLKFGFNATTNSAVTADSAFKSLAAAQTASKWECEACMTRNDAARSKCVCCEQAKPGTEALGENVPKFSFGSTAAAKFNFGFGANGAKEADLRKTTEATAAPSAVTTQKTDGNAKGFVFGSAAAASATKSETGGFTFGIKSAAVVSADASKDVADSSKMTTTTTATTPNTFKFGTTTSSTGTGFSFGVTTKTTSTATATATTPISTSTTAPSVKFSLPTVTSPNTLIRKDAQKDTLVAAAAASTTTTSGTTSTSNTFSFGGLAAANKPSAGFSFGTPPKPVTTTSATASFTFKSPATTTTAVAVTTSTTAAIAAANVTPAVAAKPMFSFGKPATSVTSTSSTVSSTTASTTASPTGFSFGSGSNSSALKMAFGATSAAPTTAAKISAPSTATSNRFGFESNTGTFGTVAASTAAPSTTANTTSATAGPTAMTSNVFGSFGASATPVFGDATAVATKPTAASNTFATFGAVSATASASTVPTASTNVFGSFGQSESTKPTAAATPIFGNATATSTASMPVATNTAFVFGSAAPAASAAGPTNTSNTNSTNSTSTTNATWSKNSFVFGGAPSAQNVVAAPSTNGGDGSKSVFGSFGTTSAQAATSNANSAVQPASIFNTISTSAPNFGNTTGAAGTSIFGCSSVPLNSGPTNLFGSMQANNNTSTATAFGASPFSGATATGGIAAPTFGSSATSGASSTGFGGFGAVSANAANTTDGASAAKKSEPVFNFGSTAPATQSTSGGFNFGASVAAKPAFNFATTNQPAFNFTGSTEAQAAKPFEFGAIPASSSVFSFGGGGGGAVEATPSAPFQFQGVAPASTNIFAPTATPGVVQSAQQTRRKIRQPIRRLTPR